MSFAQRLQAIRERRDLSQADLARVAEMHPTIIAHYEGGSREPGCASLRALAKALDVSADFLLELSNETRRLKP